MNNKEFLKKILWFFKYDRERGVLIWKNHYNPAIVTRFAGKIAGKLRQGHSQVSMDNKLYGVHRLIWFIENKNWPEMIDHIDGNPLNNKITNLRSSNNRFNQQNRHQHRAGKLYGATYHKTNRVWMARIRINKKSKYLGCFSSALEAHQAYIKEINKLRIGETNGPSV